MASGLSRSATSADSARTDASAYVPWTVCPHPLSLGPVDGLQAAFGIAGRHQAQQLLEAPVPLPGEFLHRQLLQGRGEGGEVVGGPACCQTALPRDWAPAPSITVFWS